MQQADRTYAKRLTELAKRTARSGQVSFTSFLTPAQQGQAAISARQEGVLCLVEGGTPDAERRIAAFSEEDSPIQWPIACIGCTWQQHFGQVQHRDLLGSLLGLGLQREKIGDIFVEESSAYVFVQKDIAGYVQMNWVSAGRISIAVSLLDDWPTLAAAEGTTVTGTVSSLRLDALLALGYRLSRAKAASLVISGRVQVNHMQELRVDHLVAEGSILSVRGLGRLKLEQIGGKTRKDRTTVTLSRY